jgi:hypothetical protein
MMAMSIKAAIGPDFLYVRAGGEFSLEEATKRFSMVMDLVITNNSHQVLFDGRDIVGEPTAIDRFYYAAFVSDSVERLRQEGWIENPPRFAYVLKEPVLDPMRLGETVARKRNLNLKAFDDLEKAAIWLKIDPGEVRRIAKYPSTKRVEPKGIQFISPLEDH